MRYESPTTEAAPVAGVGDEKASTTDTPAVRLRDARLSYGPRSLWHGLDLDVSPGEFLAVLGPNGSGKTSLLRVLLGLTDLSAGSVRIAGEPAHRGNDKIGYIPQQRSLQDSLALRGSDLVGLGLDGHRWGTGLRGRRRRAELVRSALRSVDAQDYGKKPVGLLSGGEQQRLRIAQALVADPRVLLCDEPLLSLDPSHQHRVSGLIARQARRTGAAVLFVTHEINPVLPMVDRVLYLVNGQFRIGTPDEVMNSETLSELYGTEVEVARVGGRLVVAGAEGEQHHHVPEGEQE
ncbi:metal ABC transporter ATP-binding protein [Actinopolyspora saharensis]|uniref:Zinc/manganese transport system ATP-binding protein n=1 Tax=Actinopolyspora saharensis TaxID=995062 RepID=A0A1H1F360_9ACTN|nr:metal ABC transporter ATP-binding protein [Actinopolyspora saharensis]SDQ95214.1 zinc/manganese transport system ATP-binding protein [Actinopolyspora saharensis]